MGGNALRVETVRKTTEEFNNIASELVPILNTDLNTDIFVTKCYHTKESHGDMDILIKIDENFHINIYDYVKSKFNPNDIHNNGGVVSFDYDNFQIDLILIKKSSWEHAKLWYSYDPIGNIIGKTAKKFGTKYGPNGLVYPFRNFNGKLSKDITLTKDTKKIYEFLGYDFDRFINGFDTLDDIFQFIINSKYFNHKIFLFENLTSIDKKRNKKRKTYQLFLKYINQNNITKEFNFNKDKSYYIDHIDEFFPEANFKSKLERFRIIDEENKEISKKFNGRLIMEKLPELKGKELGNMIGDFHKLFDDFRSYALKNNNTHIMNDFINFYNTKKGS